MPRPRVPTDQQTARINTSLQYGKPILSSLKMLYGDSGRDGEHIAAAVLFTEQYLRSKRVSAEKLKRLYDAHMRKKFRSDKHTGQIHD